MTVNLIELESGDAPIATVIVLHGLGADGNDFVPVCRRLDLDAVGPVRFVLPDAPERPVTRNGGYIMRAWFDLYAPGAGQEAEADVRASQALVDRLLAPHRRPHVVGDVNIHEVCERVRSVILAEFPRDLHIERDFDVSIPEFRGDREQLIQATLNIVHNAAQALAERRAAGDACITFKSRFARQVIFNKQWYRLALELHVIDNGPGVPDAIKDRIFYPLVSGREGGTGLGLTLAQTFVQQHHGVIECDSLPGRTDFKILIPLP